MGNRRLGAQRLNALMKRGSTETDTSYQAGDGAKNMVVSHNVRKEGKLIITEIAIDLQGKGSASIRSHSSNDTPIGEHGATGAYLLQWNDATHGDFLTAEAIVVEASNAEAAMSLSSGDAIEDKGDTVANRADVLPGIITNAAGGTHTTDDGDGASADSAALVNGEYLYLTADAAATTTFTAGKILVRLIGADTSWGF